MKRCFTITFGIILTILFSSCGKDRNLPINTQQEQIKMPLKTGTIGNAEISLKKDAAINLYAQSSFHSYQFDVQINLESNTLIAKHNNTVVGVYDCIIKNEDSCDEAEYIFDFIDRGINFTGTINSKVINDKILIKYFEQDNNGYKNIYPYATAKLYKLTAKEKINYSLIINDYLYSKIRNQNFIKRYKFTDKLNTSFIVIAKLPRRTTLDKNIYPDMFRSGFRTTQDPPIRATTTYENNVLFEGVEATHELVRIFGENNRTVGFSVENLDRILEQY